MIVKRAEIQFPQIVSRNIELLELPLHLRNFPEKLSTPIGYPFLWQHEDDGGVTKREKQSIIDILGKIIVP